MNKKIYSSQEINEILGYTNGGATTKSSKADLMRRCANAGLIIQDLPTKRGVPNQYIIIENNLTLDGEEWIPCYYSEDWEVSNLGRIRRTTTKKLLGTTDGTGYIKICTTDPKTKKSTNLSAHRLIYFSFHPELIPNANNIQIDHINGKRTDNRLENLRNLTAFENTQERDKNQTQLRSVVTTLAIKYGYEKTEKMLKKLLTNEEMCDILLTE